MPDHNLNYAVLKKSRLLVQQLSYSCNFLHLGVGGGGGGAGGGGEFPLCPPPPQMKAGCKSHCSPTCKN